MLPHEEVTILLAQITSQIGLSLLKRYGLALWKFSTYYFILTSLSGCLYSTQHFNNGRLLEPGHTRLSLGGGISHFPTFDCPDGWYYEAKEGETASQCFGNIQTFNAETGNFESKTDTLAPHTTWYSIPKIGLDYRLGVSGKWGPFTGTDIGLHLEGPTNPVTAEFDVRVGLPIPAKLALQHSLSTGWMIGAWADNSYFMEYAISRTWNDNCLFGNYRFTYLATQPADLGNSVREFYFLHKRRIIHQTSLGFTWNLPKILIVPDFITPQVILTYPLAPFGEQQVPEYILDDRTFDFNLGMGWHFK